MDDENSEKKTNSDLRKEFVHKFGMLKGQRLYDQAERLTVKSETLQANITDAAQNSSVTASDLLPKIEISYDYLLPPRNTSAAVVSYNLRFILGFIFASNELLTILGIRGISTKGHYC